jgi:hypothetical protein
MFIKGMTRSPLGILLAKTHKVYMLFPLEIIQEPKLKDRMLLLSALHLGKHHKVLMQRHVDIDLALVIKAQMPLRLGIKQA